MTKLFSVKSWPFAAWLILSLVIICGGAAYWVLNSGQVILLLPARGAQWIRRDQPFDITTGPEFTFSVFRTDFTVFAPSPRAALRVSSMGRLVVLIDHQGVYDSGTGASDWRLEHVIGFPQGSLALGTHHLELFVANQQAPSLVRADCSELGLHTDESWSAGVDPEHWSHAVLASRPWTPAIAGQFEPASVSIKRRWPLLVALFLLGCGGYWVASNPAWGKQIAWARWIKWAVIAAWAVLAANNFYRLPASLGYDVDFHLEYIRYVVHHWIPPLADQGFEMYHPPLYYFLSALLMKSALVAGASMDQADKVLRIIPLACGLCMVELCHRTARRVFPDKQIPQGVATIVGGLLPMVLYMGQFVSNEPFAACLAGVLTILCLDLLNQKDSTRSNRRRRRQLYAIGVVLALAILAKSSGLVWIVPVLVTVAIASQRNSGDEVSAPIRPDAIRWSAVVWECGTVLFFPTVIAGWYFVRNYFSLGVPFLTHSMTGHDSWWQFPGYRTPAQFLRFGSCLRSPVYNDPTSICDALYGTLWADCLMDGGIQPALSRWNFGLMACGLWLALAPMTAFIAGVTRSVFNRKMPVPTQIGLNFSLASLALFLIALMYVCLTWPIYSDVKSSYLLGATPCFAVLVAAGFDWLAPNRLVRTVGAGALTCWACTAYLTYFVF